LDIIFSGLSYYFNTIRRPEEWMRKIIRGKQKAEN